MMDRREFLGWAAASGVAMASGCGGEKQEPAAVGARDGGAGPATEARPERPERPEAWPEVWPEAWIEERSIAELGAMMASGERTARALAEAYLARIAAIDRAGPGLRAVIETNPDALAIADALDAERKAGKIRGPLHGIPVLVKDNLDTGDRMMTSAGSLALVDAPAARDATVVAKLREAGAVLLGKTNLSEWANIRSTRSVSGWSARGGQTLNPYALDRSPCGSSSGSGAAVAANLCAVAIGTETDGSILCPSAVCNLVGVKPTIGLVSRAGIVPIAHSQDTAGPMARSVADAAIVLAAIAGADPRDPSTAKATSTDYLAALTGDVRGLRVGVARPLFGYHPELDAHVEAAIQVLAGLGVEVVDPVNLASSPALNDAELTVLLTELEADLAAYLAERGDTAKVKTLADVIAFNRAHAADEMPFFAQELFEMAEKTEGLESRAYRDALATCRRLARTEGIDAVVKKHRLDAIAAPTVNPAWVIDPVLGDHFVGGSTTHAAVAGYPALTVPVGFARGVPLGMSLFGPASSEVTLLRLAAALEKAGPQRRRPAFRAHADLAAPDCGAGCL